MIYHPHCTHSAFQEALEKGPASVGAIVNTTDSLDTLLLNAAGVTFPLALAGEPPPSTIWEKADGRAPIDWTVTGHTSKGNQYIYGI